MKNKLAILLTVFSLTLMLVGVGAGTLLTQKQTRTTSLAATGAHCADTPWDWNGDHHADGACGAALGYPPGSIGGPRNAAPDLGKYFLCRTPSPADAAAWSAVGDTWYGPCDILDVQAAHDAIFGGSAPPPGVPSNTPAPAPPSANYTNVTCQTSSVGTCKLDPVGANNSKYYECVVQGASQVWYGPFDTNSCNQSTGAPSVTPIPATTTINTSIKFNFNIGTDLANAIQISDTSQFMGEISIEGSTFPIGSVLLKNMSISTTPIHIIGDSINYYQSGEMKVSFNNIDTSLIGHLAGLKIHLYSAINNSQAPIPFCGSVNQMIDTKEIGIQASPANKFIAVYGTPITIVIDCNGGIQVYTQQYTRQDLINVQKGYVDGTYSPLQISRFLVDYQQGLGLQIKFCDPTTGGCTPKF